MERDNKGNGDEKNRGEQKTENVNVFKYKGGKERWESERESAVKWRVGQQLRQSTALLFQQFKHVLD